MKFASLVHSLQIILKVCNIFHSNFLSCCSDINFSVTLRSIASWFLCFFKTYKLNYVITLIQNEKQPKLNDFFKLLCCWDWKSFRNRSCFNFWSFKITFNHSWILDSSHFTLNQSNLKCSVFVYEVLCWWKYEINLVIGFFQTRLCNQRS